MRRALTISSADCIGMVGIQKDMETFIKSNILCSSVTTSIIAQNKMSKFKIEGVSPEIIKSQIKAVFEEVDFSVIKIGTIVNTEAIKMVGKTLRRTRGIPNIVVNPQLININGESILSSSEKKALIKEIFPLAYLLILSKKDIEEILDIKIYDINKIEDIVEKLKALGPLNVLIRNLKSEDDEIDILYDGEELTYFKSENLNIQDTYIVGEKMSAAIAASIAKGFSLKTSIKSGKEYIEKEEKNTKRFIGIES